jgi:ribosome-associated translation inhibitor RaiA
LPLVPNMNRIVVIGDRAAVSRQARTYAEYRVFAVVARHTKRVQRVRVVLTAIPGGSKCDRLKCVVTVDLEQSAVLRVRATGPHVYAAINDAVERLRAAMERQLEERQPS